MRVRLALLAILLMTGCRFLSDHQQVGILKYVASTITGAVDAAPHQAAVKAPRPCRQLNALAMPQTTLHRLQHVHSRMQYAAARMNRAMNRIVHFEMFAESRTCPRTKKAAAVRS